MVKLGSLPAVLQCIRPFNRRLRVCYQPQFRGMHWRSTTVDSFYPRFVCVPLCAKPSSKTQARGCNPPVFPRQTSNVQSILWYLLEAPREQSGARREAIALTVGKPFQCHTAISAGAGLQYENPRISVLSITPGFPVSQVRSRSSDETPVPSRRTCIPVPIGWYWPVSL